MKSRFFLFVPAIDEKSEENNDLIAKENDKHLRNKDKQKLMSLSHSLAQEKTQGKEIITYGSMLENLPDEILLNIMCYIAYTPHLNNLRVNHFMNNLIEKFPDKKIHEQIRKKEESLKENFFDLEFFIGCFCYSFLAGGCTALGLGIFAYLLSHVIESVGIILGAVSVGGICNMMCHAFFKHYSYEKKLKNDEEIKRLREVIVESVYDRERPQFQI